MRILSRSLVVALLATAFARAAFARFPIDEADRIVLRGSIPSRSLPNRDVGASPADLPMEHITLSLLPREDSSAGLERLLAAQQDPAAPEFRRWVTPQEFGRQFGISDEALDTVTDWLQAHGFAIDDVSSGRQWIHFSGTAGQVEEAFRTPIHDFLVDGRIHHANVRHPSIPRALSPFVRSVLSLHDFPLKRESRRIRSLDALRPAVNFQDGTHGLGPADFAVLYDVGPLYSLGINGTGVKIAVVGRTDIKLSDVQQFRSFFGLPANDPIFVHNGPDPGNLGDDGTTDGTGEETEADLDVEWTGAVAPNASIQFVISKSTNSADGVDLSAQYAVDHNLAPVLSSSFGLCEMDLGSGNRFYNALWQQAAAQGITVFVPSGDSGVAECDDSTASSGSGRAVSGLCSTPWDVCVGGTELNDFANPAIFWSSAENPTTRESLMEYVPEVVWNESGTVAASGMRPAGSGLFASGGGPSSIYSKPPWQVAPGVPADGKRDTPDVSLNATGTDGYVVFQRYDPSSAHPTVEIVSGTSASTVAFAGLMALVVQSQGNARQGNASPIFYRIAAAQYTAGFPLVLHDVVTGNNSVPGVAGFTASAGYDLATGLGSIDATVLTGYWAAFASPRPRVRAVPKTRPAPIHQRLFP